MSSQEGFENNMSPETRQWFEANEPADLEAVAQELRPSATEPQVVTDPQDTEEFWLDIGRPIEGGEV